MLLLVALWVPGSALADPPTPSYSLLLNDCVTGNNQFRETADGKYHWWVNQNIGADGANTSFKCDTYAQDTYERPTDQTYENNTVNERPTSGTGMAPFVYTVPNPDKTAFLSGLQPDSEFANGSSVFSTSGKYYEYADITRGEAGFADVNPTEGWLFFRVELFGDSTVDDALSRTSEFANGTYYSVRLGNNASSNNAKSGILLRNQRSTNITTSWTTTDVKVFGDVNNDVSGNGGVTTVAEGGNGYEVDQGNSSWLWARRTNVSFTGPGGTATRPTIEFGFNYKKYNTDTGKNFLPSNLTYLELDSTKGLQDNQNYLWNDEYTLDQAGSPNPGEDPGPDVGIQNVYQLDTLRLGGFPQPGTKSGIKYEDDNADGDKDAGEDPLSGWVIRAYSDTNGDGVLQAGETTIADSDTTTAAGAYELQLNPGNYVVCEVLQANWFQREPVEANNRCAAISGLGPDGYALAMTSGASHTGNDFGNFRQGTKSGIKYEDDNADGDKDAGEDPLSGWVIRAYSDTNGDGVLQAGETTIADSDTTTAAGAYQLQLDPGKYVVCEVLQANWFQREPVEANNRCAAISGLGADGYAITITSGSTETGNDFGNFRQGTKSGIKYEDDNADGDKDAGEDPLSGWVIRAYSDTNGDGVLQAGETTIADSDTTTATGAYQLQLDPGKYVVCEVLQANWFQREPVEANNRCAAISGLGADGYAITITSGSTETGNDFGNFRQGTKSGIKYEDDNADGDKDAGEDPLSGWVIRAYSDTNGDGTLQAGETTIADSDTTTAAGAYQLQLDPGKYVVCEVLQANWFQREPVEANNRCAAISGLGADGYAITITSGSTETGNDFGNFRQGTKSGIKYEDDNADGDKDAGEDPLSGWVIRAYSDTNGDGTLQAGETTIADSDTTTATGAYELQLDPGKYVVCEVLQANWFQREPVEANDRCAAIAGLGADGYAITITSGSTETGNDFGNFRQGTKSGIKYEDDNADGDKDAGEDPLSGWVIRAYSDTNGDGTLQAGETTIADSDTTTATGAYELQLNPGKYVVCEVLQANWFQREPVEANDRCAAIAGLGADGYAITITSGSTETGNDFGNFRQGTKSGIKYEDDNADGDKDAGEDPLSGWVIRAYSDTNGDGTLQAGETTIADSDTTTATGAYELQLNPGKYVVCEVLQANWFQREPVEANDRCAAIAGLGADGYAITITSGSTETGNDFGNFRQGTKSGIKYEDDNADGDKDAGEDPLSGWVIRAYSDTNGDGTLQAGETTIADSDTTTATGAYELQLNPGKYVVCEVLQSGWTQREPVSADNRCAAISGLGADGYAIDVTSGFSETGNDFGNFRQGTKSGIKYEDDNANGNQDAGEDPLSGWVIRAYVDDNGDGTLQAGETTIADSDTTTATGAYELQLNPGKYVVCEVLQSGWTQREPVSADNRCAAISGLGADGYAIDVTSGFSETGNDFGNFRQGTKSGIKYEDDNADGNQDAGENPLSGWVIRAYEDENGDGTLQAGETTIADSDTTTATGAYELQLNPGKYVVCEVLQANWFQGEPLSADNRCAAISGLGPDGYAIDVTSGFTETGNDFGNYRAGTKAGIKYEDDNADGNQDAGEDPLAGWVIRAYEDENGDGTLQAGETTIADSDTTTATGAYELQLVPGKYVVCEVLQANWFQREPVEANNRCAAIAGLGPDGYALTMTSGATHTGNDFGNFRQGTKSGIKYEDDNANGNQDAGEDPLSGWVIRAYSDTNGDGTLQAGETTIADSDTTTATGAYELQLDPGKYVVCEVLQANWIQGEPVSTDNRCAAIAGLGADGYAITVTSGSSETNNDFGNFRGGTKSGIKYEDDNADGNQDAGEDPLSGWVIRAYEDENGDGTLQAGETTIADSDTTTATGAYELQLNPGKYVVCEVLQANWFQREPVEANDRCAAISGLGPDGYALDVTSGFTETGNDFGNFRQGTKSGIKYEDENGDGNQDAGENPLSGWVIRAYVDDNGDGTLQAGETTIADSDTTTATGAYELQLDPGKYVVCEVLQSGWTQREPVEANNRCAAIAGLGADGYAVTITSGSTETGNDFGNVEPPEITQNPPPVTPQAQVLGVSDAKDQRRPSVAVGGIRSRCVARDFMARVRISDASRLRSVVVRLNGKVIKRTTRKRFNVRIRANRLRRGRHKLSIVARDRAGNKRTVVRRFNRCAPPVLPNFTG